MWLAAKANVDYNALTHEDAYRMHTNMFAIAEYIWSSAIERKNRAAHRKEHIMVKHYAQKV